VVRASSADERFRSAAAAHFWYEWQVKGIALPLVTLLMLFFAALGGLAAWYMQESNLNSLYQGVLFLGGLVSALACAAGFFLGLEVDAKPTGQRETQLGDSLSDTPIESGMGSFLSSHPFTSRDYANAILRTAAQSALLAWLLWFVVFAGSLLIMWLSKQFPNPFMPRNIGVLYIPMTILGPWIALANLGSIGLSGRGAKVLFALVSCFVGYCVLMGVVNHFTNSLVAVQTHTVCTTIASMLIVISVIGAYSQAWRKKHVTSRTLVTASLTACGLAATAFWLLPADAHIIFYPTIILFAAFVVLPFASMPLAIAWNRHR